MFKEMLIDLLTHATAQAQQSGKLPPVTLPPVTIERPQNPEHGDYASSLPLKLARSAGINPLEIARELVSLIPPAAEIKSIVAAPPGFINFTLTDDWLAQQLESILKAEEAFGNIDLGHGSRVQVEFVSSNPTGPLHVAYGRAAVLGSTLSNVLAAAGFDVQREYYFNDAGNQMDIFGRSLYARYRQCLGDADAEVLSDGYHGHYMVDLAQAIINEQGERFLAIPESEAALQVGKLGAERLMAQIKGELDLLRIEFDGWFTEQSLYDNGQFDKVMEILRKGGHLVEKEGATWFTATALGEDKDEVVVRSNGVPTYLATDIAYHYNKFVERKLDRVIDIWGADHQGHVAGLRAAVGVLGVDLERLVLIVHQLVTVHRGDEVVRISTRSGDIIMLSDVIDEVGVDACRYFFLSRSANSQMDFDLELAKKEAPDNPVYYVQYAHARIASILRVAKERGITYADGDVSLLTSEPELTLIRKLLLLPEMVEVVVQTLEPHHLTYYAQDLATTFHSFYKLCRVISDDQALSKARLKLVEATKIVLARTLHLMGMTAPDRM